MEIIKRPEEEEVRVGTLKYGDIFETASGRIFMVVDGANYVTCDVVLLVELKTGIIDSMSKNSLVRPMRVVAKEV